MITTGEKQTALLALAYKLPEIADESEQDALIAAVYKAITGQMPEETEERNGNQTYAGAVGMGEAKVL